MGGRDISPVVAADTTVVLDEPVFKTGINEVPAVAAADQSSESAVSSSSDRPRIVQTEPAPVFKNSSGGLRKPNYMTATTASTHRFRLPSADNVSNIPAAQIVVKQRHPVFCPSSAGAACHKEVREVALTQGARGENGGTHRHTSELFTSTLCQDT